MDINVKCFATLADGESCDYRNATTYSMQSGARVGDLADRMGLPKEKIEIVFVNGIKSDLDAGLAEGDRVGLFPAVGGM